MKYKDIDTDNINAKECNLTVVVNILDELMKIIRELVNKAIDINDTNVLNCCIELREILKKSINVANGLLELSA